MYCLLQMVFLFTDGHVAQEGIYTTTYIRVSACCVYVHVTFVHDYKVYMYIL